MIKHQENFDSSPVSEGMQYGPIEPPEFSVDPAERWRRQDIYDNNPISYQYRIMRELLVQDHTRGLIDDIPFQANYQRLNRAIDMTENISPVIDSLVVEFPRLGLARKRRGK